MREDERQQTLRTVAEVHASLAKIAFQLCRQLTQKATEQKDAVKADQVTFRLKREMQRLALEDLEPTQRLEPYLIDHRLGLCA